MFDKMIFDKFDFLEKIDNQNNYQIVCPIACPIMGQISLINGSIPIRFSNESLTEIE